MNKSRRAELAKINTRCDEMRSELESLRDDEQNAFDQMPESFQAGERGQASENAISYLDEAISSIEEAVRSIEYASE